MFSMIKVRGNGMAPRLYDGDFVFIIHRYLNLHVGQLVVVNHALYGLIIKRILFVHENGNYWLEGENEDSIQSDKMGWIPPILVVGKVIYRLCAHRCAMQKLLKNKTKR